MSQHIFNLYADGSDPSRYWKFRPFQEIFGKDYLKAFFASLEPGVKSSQIALLVPSFYLLCNPRLCLLLWLLLILVSARFQVLCCLAPGQADVVDMTYPH